MSIDIGSERIVTLPQAAKLVPVTRNGKPPHASTIWRWAVRGLNGTKLETIQIGGLRATSAEALQRFFERLSSGNKPVAITPASRRRAIERAERELDAAGI